MEIYYDKDCDSKILANQKIAVLGYGSQGHAHALNLKDSGFNVRVGLRDKSASRKKATDHGFDVMTLSQACQWGDLIMVLLPDEVQGQVYPEEIAPHLKPGKSLFFAHGFNIHFQQIEPPKELTVCLVAPKGPGHLVRDAYTKGIGVPALVAVSQDPQGLGYPLAMAYAQGLGAGKGGIFKTTFREETETDLFGEQVVLCGGLSSLIKAGFETLVEAGYAPEMAYFECMHEVKLIVDLLYAGGLEDMRYSVSNTAQFGDLTRGPRVVNDATREEMKKILSEIQSGKFAKEWMDEHRSGCKNFHRLTKADHEHPLERVGKKIRAMMPWLRQSRVVDRD